MIEAWLAFKAFASSAWLVVRTVAGVVWELACAIPSKAYAVLFLVGLPAAFAWHLWDKHDAIAEERAQCAQQAAAVRAGHEAATRAFNEHTAAVNAAHAKQLSDIGVQYDNDIAELEGRRRADVAAALAGTLKLRYTPEPGTGQGNVPDAAGSAAERDGGAQTELPRQITADLYALAGDADEVVRQLAECQAVVRSDRSQQPQGGTP